MPKGIKIPYSCALIGFLASCVYSDHSPYLLFPARYKVVEVQLTFSNYLE